MTPEQIDEILEKNDYLARHTHLDALTIRMLTDFYLAALEACLAEWERLSEANVRDTDSFYALESWLDAQIKELKHG